MIDIETAQKMYDRNEFSAAGVLLRDHLNTRIDFGAYEIEELIFLGRLSQRLGGNTLRRIFFRAALRRFPGHPLVRYFARGENAGAGNLLRELRDFEAEPLLAGADGDLQSSRLATFACTYALFRDFDRAHRLLDMADSYASQDRAWMLSCRAEVLIAEDRWKEASDIASEAWNLSPGLPNAARNLCRARAKLLGPSGIWKPLAEIVPERRSWEVTQTTLWYLLAEAERLTGPLRDDLLARARALAEELPALMPLADRQTRKVASAIRYDVAMLSLDIPLMRKELDRTTLPFHRIVLENIKKGEADGLSPMPRFAPYKSVFQKFLTCLPSSINAVTAAFDREIDHAEIAKAITFDGTSLWRSVDWLRERGWRAMPVSVTKDLITRSIDRGVPFILNREFHLNAHAMAVVGYNRLFGTAYIHDPSCDRLQETLLDHLDQFEKPMGPIGLVILPPDREDPDLVSQEDGALAEAILGWQKIFDLRGPAESALALQKLLAVHGPLPPLRILEARLAAAQNDVPAALRIQTQLLMDYPDCIPLQRDLINSWHQTRDSASLVRFMETLIRKGRIEGIDNLKMENSLPAGYHAQYADYLGSHRDGFIAAQKILMDAIFYVPIDASLHHVLGDVLGRDGRYAESELPLRLAAQLNRENHHYTRAYADILRRLGREAEAVAYLEKRLSDARSTIEGPVVFIQLADALEDWGRAERCAEVLASGLADYGAHPGLLSWAIHYYLRNGKWSDVPPLLAALERTGNRELWLEASIQFHLRAGRWEKAADLTEIWIAESPDDFRAARALAELLPFRSSPAEIEVRLKAIVDRHPYHDDFGGLYLRALDASTARETKNAFLRERIAHYPEDTWALTELGHQYAEACELAAGDPAALEETRAIIGKLKALNKNLPGLMGLEARIAVLEGKDGEAIDILFRVIEQDPFWDTPYRHIAEIRPRLDPTTREDILTRLEDAFRVHPGALTPLADTVEQIARSDGYAAASAFLDRVGDGRPLDPLILGSRIDLELCHGNGMAGLKKAGPLIEAGLRHFPGRSVFLIQKIRAGIQTGEAVVPLLEQLIAREPCHLWGQLTLAGIHERAGRVDEAVSILETAIAKTPLEADLWIALAKLHQRRQRAGDAEAALRRALERASYSISLRERAIELFQDFGDHGEAVDIARKGTELYPEGAYLWFLYGSAMHRSPHHNNLAVIEEAYRTALAYNGQLFMAADLCSVLLSMQGRHEDALRLVDTQYERNPSEAMAARGRRAWILRHKGNLVEAVESLEETLRRYPHYVWGWNLFFSWLEADGDWPRILEWLKELPPALRNDSRQASERLRLLEKAGMGWEGLQREWRETALLYPQDEDFQFVYFDALRARNLVAEAAAVLDAIEPFSGNALGFRVRRAQILCPETAPEEAARLLVSLYRDFPSAETFPGDAVETMLTSLKLEAAFSEMVLDAMEDGEALRPEAVAVACRLWGGSEDALIERIGSLLAAQTPETDRQGLVRWSLLEALLDRGYRAKARLYVRNNFDECRAHPLLWGECTRLVTDESVSESELESWYEGWQERIGVRMWHIANYLIARPDKSAAPFDRSAFARISDVSEEALTLLPPDHTQLFLVVAAIENAFRGGKQDRIERLLSAWRGLLADPSPDSWFPDAKKDLPRQLKAAYSLLTAPETELPRAIAVCVFAPFGGVRPWTVSLWIWCLVRRRAAPVTALGLLGLGLRWIMTAPTALLR